MNRESISMLQLLFLLTAILVSTGHFLFVRIVLIQTGHDGWLVIGPAVLIGFAAFYAIIRLSQKYNGLTLIEISLKTYGKWVGRLLTVPYLLFFMVVPSVIIRAVGDFLPSTMPYTPYGVITTVVVLLSALAVRFGIEVLGRCAELILPGLVFLGLLASMLITKDKHIEYLLPIFQSGFAQLMKGTLSLAGLFCEVVVAGMMLSSLRTLQNAQKSAGWFFVLIAVMFIGPMTGPPMVFDSELAPKFSYPTYEEIRYIEVTNVVERPDILAIILWAFGSFLKISAFLYALCLAFAQWIGVKNYRPFVMPFAVCLLIQASHFASNRAQVWNFLTDEYPLFALTVGLVLPWVTLLVSRFQKGSNQNQQLAQ